MDATAGAAAKMGTWVVTDKNPFSVRPEEPPFFGGVSKPVLSPVEGGALARKSTAPPARVVS